MATEKITWKTYVKSAFNAKPWGMFISPNWVGLISFGMLGAFLHPGFLLIGAGLEMGYLYTLTSNSRFQNFIRANFMQKDMATWQTQFQRLMDQLLPEAKQRFNKIMYRCETIMEYYQSQLTSDANILDQHYQSLNKLLWVFLQLLIAKQYVEELIKGHKNLSNLEDEAKKLQDRLQKPNITPELKKSLETKLDIMQQRLQTLKEAENKQAYVDAELDRIEQQAELIREQAVVSKDSSMISSKVDTISSSLGETSEWIKQQQMFGAAQEMMNEPPVILARQKVTE